MPTVVTNKFREQLSLKQVDMENDTFYISLMDNYVKNSSINTLKAVAEWSAVSANETSGSSYDRKEIGNKDISIVSNVVVWEEENISWTDVTLETYGACIYKDDGLVVGFIEFSNSPIQVVNGTLGLQWNNGKANII